MRVFLIVVALAALAGGGTWFYLNETDQVDDVIDLVASGADRVRVPVQKALGHEPHASKVIYLNREGGTFVPGFDDARKNRSSLVRLRGLPILKTEPFAGTNKSFQEIADCVAENFERYDVEVVTQRPIDADYLMVAIGGKPGKLKDHVEHKGMHLFGLSPSTGGPVERAIVFVFASELKNNTRRVCETTSHEIAHAYGLDHTRECSDLMSYKKPCKKRREFSDKDVPCGETSDRPCDDGTATQNSHRALLELLGPAKPE